MTAFTLGHAQRLLDSASEETAPLQSVEGVNAVGVAVREGENVFLITVENNETKSLVENQIHNRQICGLSTQVEVSPIIKAATSLYSEPNQFVLPHLTFSQRIVAALRTMKTIFAA